jgi:hypothetical protein
MGRTCLAGITALRKPGDRAAVTTQFSSITKPGAAALVQVTAASSLSNRRVFSLCEAATGLLVRSAVGGRHLWAMGRTEQAGGGACCRTELGDEAGSY